MAATTVLDTIVEGGMGEEEDDVATATGGGSSTRSTTPTAVLLATPSAAVDARGHGVTPVAGRDSMTAWATPASGGGGSPEVAPGSGEVGVEEEEEEDVPWEALDALVKGETLLKFGRQGEPHFRKFSVDLSCQYLQWVTHKKKTAESRVLLANCGLTEGQGTDVFKRQPRPDLVDCSFSLSYEDPKRKGVVRTLDVVCKDRHERELWLVGLSYLIQGPPPTHLVEARRRLVWNDMLASMADGSRGVAGGAMADGAGVDGSGVGPSAAGDGDGSRKAATRNITRDLKMRMKDRNDVYAWGSNAWGECGLGDEAPRPAPTLISLLLGKTIRTVACGAQHVLALADSGECYAWGHGGCGRLGTGGCDPELLPRPLIRPGKDRAPFLFRAIAAGDMHSAAIDVDSRAYTWGAGGYGQLGHRDDSDRLLPTPIATAVCVSVSYLPTAASNRSLLDATPGGPGLVTSSGTATTPPPPLGRGDSARSVGRGSLSSPSGGGIHGAPRMEWGAASYHCACPAFIGVAAGTMYTAFIDASGRLYTCGIDDAPLGHDASLVSTVLRASSGVITFLDPALAGAEVAELQATAAHAVQQYADRAVAAAAAQAAGAARSPIPSVGPAAAGGGGEEAREAFSPMQARGRGSRGSLDMSLASSKATPGALGGDDAAGGVGGGDGAVSGPPTHGGHCSVLLQVCAGFDVIREHVVGLSCGAYHMGMITNTGNCYMWGCNSVGQCGVGDTLDRALPTRVINLPREAVALACGGSHTLALVDDRTTGSRLVYAWGSCLSGQVPASSTVAPMGGYELPDDPAACPPCTDTPAYHTLPRLLELPVPPGSAAAATVALSTSMGDGPSPAPSPSSPQGAPKPRPVARVVAAGAFHSAVITDDGALYVFGEGSAGQLGLTTAHLHDAWKRVKKNRTVEGSGRGDGRVSLARRTLRSGLDRIRTLGTLRPAIASPTLAPSTPVRRIDSAPMPGASDAIGGDGAGVLSARTTSNASEMEEGDAVEVQTVAIGASTRSLDAALSGLSGTGSARPLPTSPSSVPTASAAAALAVPAGWGGHPKPFHATHSASLHTLVVPPPTIAQVRAAVAAGQGLTAPLQRSPSALHVTPPPSLVVPSIGAAPPAHAPHLSVFAPTSVVHASVYFPSQCDDFAAGVFQYEQDDAGGGDEDGDSEEGERPVMEGARPGSRGGHPDSTSDRASPISFTSPIPVSPAPVHGGRGRLGGSGNSPGSIAPLPLAASRFTPHSPSLGPMSGRRDAATSSFGLHDRAVRAGSHAHRAAPVPAMESRIPPLSDRDLDVRRPPSPTHVAEYRSGTYGIPPQDDIMLIMESRGRSHIAGFSHVHPQEGGAPSTTWDGETKLSSPPPPLTRVPPPAAPPGTSSGDALATVKAVGLVGAGSTGGGGLVNGDGSGVDTVGRVVANAPTLAQGPVLSSSRGISGGGASGGPFTELPLPNTLPFGPLPVVTLARKEVRSVACGLGFTVCTVATEWIKDDEAPNCMQCNALFTVTRRRHHCRNCGGVFCDKCSSQRRPLLKLGFIEPVRVCDGCYAKLQYE